MHSLCQRQEHGRLQSESGFACLQSAGRFTQVSRMLKSMAMTAKSRVGVLWGRLFASISLLSIIALGVVLATLYAGRPDIGAWVSLTGFVAILLIATCLAQLFYHFEGLFEQRGRDLRAHALWTSLEAGVGEAEPFILYLRPFASTDEIEEYHPDFGVSPSPNMEVVGSVRRLEFEEQIERAFRPIGLTVGLGRPLEHIGAGRITLKEDEWRSAIHKLMRDAELIVLLPSSVPGTIWEVEKLLSTPLMMKTIVVDPPNRKGSGGQYDPSAEWKNIQNAFAAQGYFLPDDDPDGLLLYYGSSNEPIKKVRLNLDDITQIRRFARTVIKMRGTVYKPIPEEDPAYA